MKKKVFIVFVFFVSLFVYSQETGVILIKYKMATYQDASNKKNETISLKDKEILKDVKDVFDSMEFNLFIEKNKSLFKINEQLDKADDDFKTKKLKSILSGGVYYFDKNLNEIINSTEFQGEKFNILVTPNKYKWVITSEKKDIGGYECIKAVCHIEQYQKLRDRTISFDPYVWFSPKLPYAFGPKDMNGLPGLILEASLNSKTYFYATEINLEYNKSKIIIDRPNNGKFVSEKEFEDLQVDLSKKG